MRPNIRLVELVDAALGHRAESSLGELSSGERERISQLRAVGRALGISWFAAPDHLTKWAKDCFPMDKRTARVANLLNRDLGLAGARSGRPESAHLIFDLEGKRARIMIEQEGQAWRVFGRVEGREWIAELQGQAMECAEGQFEFVVATVEDAKLVLESAASIYELDLDIQA